MSETARLHAQIRRNRLLAEENARLQAKIERMYKAAKAYCDLSTCYRTGKRPSEKLFKQLEHARLTLEEEGSG